MNLLDLIVCFSASISVRSISDKVTSCTSNSVPVAIAASEKPS
jgi:hypothetical protein